MGIKVNGWAASGDRSIVVHAIPWPGEMGSHARAVCGKLPNTHNGWQEPASERLHKCGPCQAVIDANG